MIWSSAHRISELLFEFIEKLVIRLLIIFSGGSETILLATSIKIAVHVVQIVPVGKKREGGWGVALSYLLRNILGLASQT